MRQSTPTLISDCAPGDVVRVALGNVRVCSLSAGGERWCRLVDDDLRELDDIVWVANRTPVIETLRAQRQGVSESVEVDPLLGRRVR
jgi:hypothetical protein